MDEPERGEPKEPAQNGSEAEPPAEMAPEPAEELEGAETAAEAQGAETAAQAQTVAEPVAEAAPPPPPRRPGFFTERPEEIFEVSRERLAAHTRRDFILFGLGTLATASAAWWLLPDRTKARLLPGPWRDRLDTLAARVGMSRESRERVLNQALTFDDDVSEALYSSNRMVRTYPRSAVTNLPINYNGVTPGPEYLAGWKLRLLGLASGRALELPLDLLMGTLKLYEQVTRLVCVEGWSGVAWWNGFRFPDLLKAFPPAPGARWAAMRSGVGLDGRGQPDPYYVSIDLGTARHPQTMLATHFGGRPLSLDHGAPLRLVAPMKLGLKNIKAITEIEYTSYEPPDYWNERGYSKYDGL